MRFQAQATRVEEGSMYSDNNTPTQPYHIINGEPRRRRAVGSTAIVGAILLGGVAGGVAGGVVGHFTAPTATRAVVDRTAASAPPAAPVSDTIKGPPLRTVDTGDRAVQVVQRVGPAVVTIQTSGVDPSTGQNVQATGSGVIIDPQGDILTNDHVVQGGSAFTVVFKSGDKASASVVREAAYTDLAVIHVDAKVPAYAELGDSARARPGETVLAIGNPLGSYQNTVTEGIISAVGRTLQESESVTLNNLLQTDAAINHGNSGGPLVDLNGKVIGINTAVVRSSNTNNTQDPFGGLFGGIAPNTTDQAQGIGFAIPSKAAQALVGAVQHHLTPAFLGVQPGRTVDPQTATYYNVPIGVVVQSVDPNTPAAQAGIHAKDIVTSLGGQAIDQNHDLHSVVEMHQPGETVKVTAWRAGQTLTFNVKLAPRPTSAH